MADLSQLRRLRIKQTEKKTLVGSGGWLAPAAFLEFAAPNELKKLKLAPRRDVNRRHPIDGAGCGSCGRGLSLRSRAVRVSTPSTLGSGGQVLGLGVSDDRVTPAPPAGVTRGLDRIACSLKPREESRDGAPRGERARSALRRSRRNGVARGGGGPSGAARWWRG